MMNGKKIFKVKRLVIWLKLLAKRLWRQPAYIGLVLLIPILGYAVSMMEQEGAGGVSVSVCAEEGTWSRQIMDGLRVQEADSVLAFVFYDNADAVRQSVMGGTADCGFVIPSDIQEMVLDKDWQKSIRVYETSGSSITGMAKERISGVIFKLYSERRYQEYMGQISEDIVDFAQDAYESHMVDGSTFEFRYINDNQYSQHDSDTDDIYDTSVFPIKGVFAVVIFISGMCGMLEYDTDKKEKRFVRMASNRLTYLVDIWIPTVFISAAVLICLWISDGVHNSVGQFFVREILSVWDAGMWISQIGKLIVYQCVIVLYCCILGVILKRRETIAAAIPLLSLGSLVCAPVFIRLAAYMPVFVVLEKLFPVTYYLMM